MYTRAKHYQALREEMVNLKKALQGVANFDDDFTGKDTDNISNSLWKVILQLQKEYRVDY